MDLLIITALIVTVAWPPWVWPPPAGAPTAARACPTTTAADRRATMHLLIPDLARDRAAALAQESRRRTRPCPAIAAPRRSAAARRRSPSPGPSASPARRLCVGWTPASPTTSRRPDRSRADGA